MCPKNINGLYLWNLQLNELVTQARYGVNINFQCTKYKKNHFDTFSAMFYFILMFYRSSFSHMASNVTPRYVCGDIYMKRSAYARCKKFPPKFNESNAYGTGGKEW